MVESIKIEQKLKNGQNNDAKIKKKKNIWFLFSMKGYHSIYTVDLTDVVSNY